MKRLLRLAAHTENKVALDKFYLRQGKSATCCLLYLRPVKVATLLIMSRIAPAF